MAGEPLRLLHLITSLDRGGAETMVARLAHGLPRERFEQTVVSLTTAGAMAPTIRQAGVTVETLGLSSFAAWPLGLLRFRRMLRRVRPDVIQTWLYHGDLFALLANALPGRTPPFMWNIRCADTGLQGRAPLAWRMLKTLAHHAHRPTVVVVNSVAGQTYHQSIGYHPRCWALIPNGFDLTALQPDSETRDAVRRELGLADDAVAVGLFARLHAIKDHATFLRAAAMAQARSQAQAPNLVFILVGLGLEADNANLRRLMSAVETPANLRLLGQRDDATRLMQGLDIACLTSLSEGFPNVIGEAMASGVPAVVSNAGDMANMVGDTGRVLPVGDAAGFADAFCELATMPAEQRQALGQAARRRIADTYSLDQVVDSYATLYEGLYEESAAS